MPSNYRHLSEHDAESRVFDLEAQLHQAQFDLDSTVVRAPSDGVVTQLTVRPGMMAGVALLKPVLVFEPRDEVDLIRWFRQNSLLHLREGSAAEVAFDALPGQVFKGRMKQVLPFIAEGQLQPTADLIEFREHAQAGRVAVAIEIDDPAFDKYNLPQGLFGQFAVYSEHAHHLAMLRRILMRMASWMDYLFPFH